MQPAQIIVGVAGLFSFAGGLFGWSWFLNSRKARLFVRLFGDTGARLFYMIFGLALVAFAVFGNFGGATG